MGTLTISSDGQLFDPALVDMQIETNLTIEGYVRPNSTSIQYNTQIPVYMRAASVAKNKVIKSTIIAGNLLTLGKNPKNVPCGTDSLYVYLILVNEPMIADYFVPGTIYRLTDASTVGSFELEATDSGANTPPADIPISVNGDPPAPDAPFIGSGSKDVPDIPYEGEFVFDHYFNFTIVSDYREFSILIIEYIPCLQVFSSVGFAYEKISDTLYDTDPDHDIFSFGPNDCYVAAQGLFIF